MYLFDAYKRYVPTSWRVQINVLNGLNNEAPRFERAVYEAQIVENNAPNTLVVKVSFELYENLKFVVPEYQNQ